MRKLIAKTIEGREYMHSRKSCFFAERNAKAICDALNAEKYNLNGGSGTFMIMIFRKSYIVAEKSR